VMLDYWKTETKAENLYMTVESDWISCQNFEMYFQSILLMVGKWGKTTTMKNPLYNYIIAQNINNLFNRMVLIECNNLLYLLFIYNEHI
jgi:hypothetical protein